MNREQAFTSKYRHDFGRKVCSFDDIADKRPINIPACDVPLFNVYEDDELDCPLDNIPADAHADEILFVWKHKGQTYLVNTEGHDYCRYITPCVIVEDNEMLEDGHPVLVPR